MKRLILFFAVVALLSTVLILSGCGKETVNKKLQLAVFYGTSANRQQEQYFDSIARAILVAQEKYPDKFDVEHIRIPLNDKDRVKFIESQLANNHYDLVIDTDINYTNSIESIAEKQPKTSFVIVDPSNSKRSAPSKNVTWIVFDEKQQGFVAGVIASLKKPGKITHLDLCLDDINPDYNTGIKAGVKAVNNGSTFSLALIAKDVHQRKDIPGNDLYELSREKALEIYRGDCDVIISDWETDQLAVLAAAHERKKFVVVSDVTFRHIANVASMKNLAGAVEKNYKLAIVDTIAAKINGSLKNGDVIYNLSNDWIIYSDKAISDTEYQSLIKDTDKFVVKLKNGDYKID